MFTAVHKIVTHSGSINRSLPREDFKGIKTNQFRPQLSCVVPMSKAAIFPQTPAIQLPAGGDRRAVRAATGDVTDALGLQSLDQPRLVTVPKARKSDFSLISRKVKL